MEGNMACQWIINHLIKFLYDCFLTSLLNCAKNDDNNADLAKPVSPNLIETSNNEKTKQGQHIWKYDEVVELIKSMGTHIDDLNHPKIRKQVFENVANDLISLKYEVNSIIYTK